MPAWLLLLCKVLLVMDALKVLNPTGVDFAPLPSIYSIELTAACDLACPMCLRSTHLTRQPKLLSVDLIKQMYARGEFAGTAFIELQQAGEPTIHPQLGVIIQMLKSYGLLVGLSTHGLNMTKPGVTEALLQLDTLTISIDSVDPDVYHKMRYPATFDKLNAQLQHFMPKLESRKYHDRRAPLVEFQLIQTSLVEGSGNIEALVDYIERNEWEHVVTIRTNTDMFMEMQGRAIIGSQHRPGNGQLCLNPFKSVSINQDGDVLSCCMIFNPNKGQINYYGNLYEQPLADIWNSSKVQQMRYQHRMGKERLQDECAKCYGWSPVNIHDSIVRGLVRQ